MSTATITTARRVSRAIARAGIPTGYRYTQTGYTDRDGIKVRAPGVEVTRRRRARYGGYEDYGYVAVFLIDPSRPGGGFDPEFRQLVVDALTDAGLDVDATGVGAIKVLDPQPEGSNPP